MKILCSLRVSNCTQCNHNTALLKSFWSESNVTALLNVTLLSSFCPQGLSLPHLECDSPTVAASGSGDIICLLFSSWFSPPGENKNAAQRSVLSNAAYL